jgi:hypothetical protein
MVEGILMARRSCALVVTADLEKASTWMGWLRSRGHMTLACVGPDRTGTCPHANGHLCPLRGVSELTIVDTAADPMGTCTAIGRQPSIRVDRSIADRRAFEERIRSLRSGRELLEGWAAGSGHSDVGIARD